MLLRKIVTFFISLLSIISFAQNDVSFRRYSIDEGLSQGNVNTIIQDSKGFMWFGTQDGLNRFDGYDFKVYKADPEIPNSISNSVVKAIYETSDGKIYLGTAGGGLNVFDREYDSFKHYKHDPKNANSISSDAVYAIYEDKDSMVWIGTLGGGVCMFNPKTETFERFMHDPSNPYSLSGNSIRAIVEDHDGELWIGVDGGGLNKFDRRRKRFTHFQHDPNNPESLGSDKVLTILVDNDGTFWVGSWAGGISHFYPKTGKSLRYVHDPSNLNSINNNETFSMCRASNGQLWVVTRRGLDLFDEENNRFIHHQNNPIDPTSLSHDIVIYVMEDRSGVLWVGTEGGGINTLDLKKKRFLTYKNDFNDPNSLNDDEVLSMTLLENGKFMFGTQTGGVNILDWKTQKFTFMKNEQGKPRVLNRNDVAAVVEDERGNYWFGSNGGGLTRYNPNTGRSVFIDEHPQNPDSLKNNAITSLAADRYGMVWVGTYGGGMARFDYKTNKFKTYTIDADNQMMDVVLTVMEDADGDVWGGTFGHGLIKYDRENDKFIYHKSDRSNPNAISSNVVTCLYEDQYGNIWVGTGGAGIDKFNKQTSVFKNYNSRNNNLISDMISSVLCDDSGNIWVATVKGLSKFNLETEMSVKNYDREDGLQDNDFVVNSAIKTPKGRLFFGGRKGFNVFCPDSIVDNDVEPYVAIIDFKIFNKSQTIGKNSTLTKTINETDEIKLSYKDYVFSFEFSALHYATPIKNQFKYMMEGFDDDWVTTTYDRRFANYTNLPGGEYTFRVIASNNDGVWNEEGASIKVIVVPPFYKTTWFYILVFIVISSLLFIFFKYREKQARLHREELQQKINQAIDEVEVQKKEILSQNEALQQRQKEDEQRRWFNEGLALFGEILRLNKDSIQKLSHEVLSNLMRYIGASQGGIYVINDEVENDKYLELISSYAYDADRLGLERIEIGETLVGNCYIEKKTKYYNNFPKNYLKLTSSLGETTPFSLLLIPLRLDELIFGVIEISSLKEITPFEIEFVEKLAESVTSQLFTTKISEKTQKLLEQSQKQAEELRSQEEEARQNIEEMQANREEATRLKSEAMGYLNSMNHSIIRADFSLDGKLEYANTRFLDYYGYNSKEAYGMYVSDFFNEEDRKDFLERWDALLKGSKHIEEKFNHKTKTGNISLLSTYTTVKDLNGNIQKILYLGLDLSKQEDITTIDSVELSAIDDMILRMELNKQGVILDINNKLSQIFGYEKDELMDLELSVLLSEDEKKIFFDNWDKVVCGEKLNFEFVRTNSDGEIYTLSISLVPHCNAANEVYKVSLVGVDISEQKVYEDEIKRKIEIAEEKELELTIKINELQEELNKKK